MTPRALDADESIEVVVGVCLRAIAIPPYLRAKILHGRQIARRIVGPAEVLDDRPTRTARRELAPATLVVVGGHHAGAGAQSALGLQAVVGVREVDRCAIAGDLPTGITT